MTIEIFAALMLFGIASSITPGPNNLMLMASGANFGFRATIPHMLGISGGFALMLVLVGAGLIRVFDAFPVSYTALKIASVAYLLYLAAKIATAAPTRAHRCTGQPMTFLQAAAFQWVNPKAWTMALTAITVYAPGGTLAGMALVAAILATVNLPSVTVWTVMGQQMARLLTNPRRRAVFNWGMAGLLVLSLYPVILPA